MAYSLDKEPVAPVDPLESKALDALICLGNEKYFTTPEDVSVVTSLCRSQRYEEALWDSCKDIESGKKRTRLMYAAKTNDKERIRFLLARNANINTQNIFGCSALHYACEYGHMEAVQELIHHSSRGRGQSLKGQSLKNNSLDLNCQDTQGVTPVMKCTSNVNMVDYLLTHGADPFITDHSKRTVLHLACGQYSNEDSAEYLIATYPDLCKLKTNKGYTALHAAVKYRTTRLVNMLLPHSEIDAVNDHGHTALSIAIKAGKKWMVEVLLEAGAQWTPLFQLHSPPSWIDAQANYYVDSPIHFAAKYNQVDVLYFLLRQPQCNVKSLNDEGESAFWRACRQGSTEAVKLLYHASDIYQGCLNRWTPLNIAVLCGHYKIVEYFCQQKANLNLQLPLLHRNMEGDTALVLACANNYPDIVQLLVDSLTPEELEANETAPMSIAVRHGFSKVVQILVHAKANSTTAMQLACEHNRSDIVEILLDNGHSVNELIFGMTPLMLASREGALATMQTLLRRGADRNFVADTGETALTLAHEDIRECIIQLVCNV